MQKVKGVKTTLEQVLNSDSINAANTEWVVPDRATILSNNFGTLVELEGGSLYLVSVGNWFRSIYSTKTLPQVLEFNDLQDKGLTAIKDKVVRHEKNKPETKQVVKENGQEIRGKNNVGFKKVDKTMASNTEGEKKD
jgi:hypothetical protein